MEKSLPIQSEVKPFPVCDITQSKEQPTRADPSDYQSHQYDCMVLSGNSARGLVTMGAVQYLIDNNFLNPHTLIGTSSGAIINFLYAIGIEPIDGLVYLCTTKVFEQLSQVNVVSMLHGTGAVSYAHITETLEKIVIAKIGFLPTLQDVYEKFNKTLIIVTHNATTNETEYLSPKTHPTLPCLTAIRMSANLPLVFDQFQYNGSYYIDGGLSDNFAIHIGDKMGKKVIGFSISDKADSVKFEPDSDAGILSYFLKIMAIPISHRDVFKCASVSDKCTIVHLSTTPGLVVRGFGVSTRERINMFCSGYLQTKTELGQ